MAKAVPAINEPFVNSEGKITDIWYKYLLSLGLSPSSSGGGSDENEIPTMGKIIQTILPIDDDNVHLLDGELLSYSDEKYQNFIDYVISLMVDYPDLFCSEADYQTSITNYGVCGKFVYDNEENTLRLPTITGFAEGSVTLTEIGDLTEAGLPNITGTIGNICVSVSSQAATPAAPTGAFSATRSAITGGNATGAGRWIGYLDNTNIDASRSSSIYGNNTIVQPQSVKVLFYIVINNLTNSVIKNYLDANASRTIDKYVNTVSKPDIDSEVESGKNEIDGIVETGKSEIQNAINSAIAQLLAADRNIPFMKFEWDDKLRNDISWLRADTFSWQDGTVYEGVYNHLVDDIDGKTIQTETVSGITIQFYLADDGHKIAPTSEESNILSLYNTTGIAWYYILDTVNQRFKLPRTKYGFTGLRDNVGKYVSPGLPNITGRIGGLNIGLTDGAFYNEGSANGATGNVISIPIKKFDASRSSSIYGNSTTVQPPATQMYLYFYVGDYTHTAIENTAGLNTELFNNKADTDLNNIDSVGKSLISGLGMPSISYIEITPPTINTQGTYTAPANGYMVGSFNISQGATAWLLNKSVGYLGTQDWSGVTGTQRYRLFCPIAKGQEAVFKLSGGSYDYLRFYYAKGEI